MSSILDALAKIEAAEARSGGDVTVAAAASQRTWRAAVIGAILLAFASGVTLSVWMLRARPVPVVVAAPAPAAPKPSPAASKPAPTHHIAPPPVVAAAPPPTVPPAAPQPPPIAHEPLAIAPPVPPPAPAAPERPSGVVVPTPPVPSARPAAPPPPPPVATAAVDRPRVRVSFLIYSPIAARRSVALTIEDGNLATLHEGEASGGVEVTHIHPDHVELRHGAQTFTVRARD